MFFLNRIVQLISSIGRGIMMPFHRLRFFAVRMNPVRIWRSLKTTFMMPIRGMRATLGRLNPRYWGIPKIKGLKIPGLGGKFGLGIKEWLASLKLPKLFRAQKYLSPREKAEFSQIHLVNQQTLHRTVLHIGMKVGTSRSEIQMIDPSYEPVHLRFISVAPALNNGHSILLEIGKTKEQVLVDSKRVARYAPVDIGSIIKIGAVEYRFEMYAWDNLPAIARVDASWKTDKGPVREHNEDAIGIFQHEKAYMFVIADGVGGGEAGERISEFAVQYMLAAFQENIKYDLSWHDVMRQAFEKINDEVRRFAKVSEFVTGSTLLAIVVQGWDAYIAHVGDSRAYHFTEGRMRQITKDHLIPSEPNKTSKGAPSDQVRYVLGKAIGKEDDIAPDLSLLRLQPKDRIMICSDGILQRVEEKELRTLAIDLPPKAYVDRVSKLAHERYNDDNFSIVMLDLLKEGKLEDDWRAVASDRVYVNYDRSWRFKLESLNEMHTDYPLLVYATNPLTYLVAGILIVLLVFWGFSNNNTDAAASEANVTATSTFVDLPTATETAQSTDSPTQTSIAPATATAIPPTSTLRPVPSSTLARSSVRYEPEKQPEYLDNVLYLISSPD